MELLALNLLYLILPLSSLMMDEHFYKLFKILLIILFSVMLGYVLRIHHETKITESYQSQAEQDLATLEEEFHAALEKPLNFLIFNGKFEVYPARESDERFHYNKPKDYN